MMSNINDIGFGSSAIGLMNSQMLKFFKTVRDYNYMLSRIEPTLKVAEELNKYYRSLNPITYSPILNMINEIDKYHDILFGSIGYSAIKIAENLHANYHSVFSLTNLPAMNAIVGGIHQELFDKNLALRNSFLGKIVNKINIVPSTELKTDDIESIENYFDNKCGDLIPNILSYEGMVNLFFAIILFLFSVRISNISEQKIVDTILNSQQTILEQIEKLKPLESNKSPEVFYIVIRGLIMREKPTNKSNPLGSIYHNQKVILLQEKGKWIYIEYFDYVNGVNRKGWALKKYLKRIRN